MSRAMFDLLATANRSVIRTGGIFDPAILSDLEAAGYDRDFALLDAALPVASRTDCTAGHAVKRKPYEIELNVRLRTVTVPPDVRLDLGGIAKGWSADRVAERLARFGDVLVDAGGDIRAVGEGDWRVGVPVSGGRLAVVPLARGAIATSSVLRRMWHRNGGRAHHLIDPRSGRPAETDVVQASVLAASASEAEVWAKVLVIAGSGTGLRLIERRNRTSRARLEALWMRRDGTVDRTPGWPGDCRAGDDTHAALLQTRRETTGGAIRHE